MRPGRGPKRCGPGGASEGAAREGSLPPPDRWVGRLAAPRLLGDEGREGGCGGAKRTGVQAMRSPCQKLRLGLGGTRASHMPT